MPWLPIPGPWTEAPAATRLFRCAVDRSFLQNVQEQFNLGGNEHTLQIAAWTLAAALVLSGLGILLKAQQLAKMVSSYVGENKIFEQQFLSGELKVELNPQGTLAERIRAGGAGIGGFFTRAGVGTVVAEGKETRVIDGEEYVLEMPLKAEFALVKASRGDAWGNLVFDKTTRNFSSLMCAAARTTIVEVEELVPVGSLAPSHVHVPGIYVHRIFQGSGYQKWIERRTVRPRAS